MERMRQIRDYERGPVSFLRDAVAAGADKKIPPGVTPQAWQRDDDICKAIIDTTLNGRALGDIYGITREWVRQIRQKHIVDLWGNSPEDLRERYRLKSILKIRKPFPRGHGENYLKIKGQVSQGTTDVFEIAKRTGLSINQIKSSIKPSGKNLPVEFPLPSLVSDKDFKRQLQRIRSNAVLQNILDNAGTRIVYFVSRNRKNPPVILNFLTNILKEEGLHIRAKDRKAVISMIKKAHIPIAEINTGYKTGNREKGYKQRYVVVFTRHQKEILEVLKKDEDLFKKLSDNPVKLAYGPAPEKFPNTTQFKKKKEYKPVGNILREYFGFVHSTIRYDDLLVGSPVSIFRAGTGERADSYLCSINQEKALVNFLRKRLKQLGRIK